MRLLPNDEMLLVLTHAYEKRTFYLLLFISTPIGLIAAFLEFVYGDIIQSTMLFIGTIGWSFFILLPSIRKITQNQKLINKTGSPTKNKILNKPAVLVERIISLIVLVSAIVVVIKIAVSGDQWYSIPEGLWVILISAGHFLLIIISRLASKA